LKIAPGDLVPLEEELDLTGSYLDIEAARFGDRLGVEIDFPDHLRGAMAPHFILQPLAENAIKHGVAPAKRPVKVTLRASSAGGRLILTVTDDAGVGGALPAANGGGVGLSNVRARLHALFGDDASLQTSAEDGCFTAEIVMPLKMGREDQAAA
jgi:LytS/YehU family sensor histidine kinase